MKLFGLIVTIIIFPPVVTGQISDKDPGSVLLNSYSCDTIGGKSADQLQSLRNLKHVVTALELSDECKALANQISSLPMIDDILDSFKQNSIVEAIQQEEAIINQALADLQAVQDANPSEDERFLYPSPEILRLTIQNAKTRLTEKRAQLAAEEIVVSRDQYLKGINQLNNLGTTVGNLLSSPDDQCLAQNPQIRNQIASSIFGISGFFMNQPLGIATNLAGKLLQNVFKLVENAKRSKNHKDAFQAADDVALISGLSCALESLGARRCKITREHELFKKVVKARSSNDLENYLSELESATCNETHIILPALAEMSIGPVIQWVRDGENLGVGTRETSAQQARGRALASFMNASTAYTNRLKSISSAGEQFSTELGRQNDQMGQLMSSFEKYTSFEAYDGDSMFSDKLPRGVLSQDEHSKLMIKFLLPPDAPATEVDNQFQQLKTEYTSFYSQRYGGGQSIGGFRPIDENKTAAAMLREILESANMDIQTINQADNLGAATKRIANLLTEKDTLTNYQMNLISMGNRVKENLGAADVKEKKDALVLAFFSASAGRTSPYQHLKRLKEYLDNLPDLPSEKTAFLGINALKSRLEGAVTKADEMLAEQANSADQLDWSPLIQQMASLVGENSNLAIQFANINRAVHDKRAKELQNGEMNLTAEQETEYNNALFLLNMDVLSSAVEISLSPSDQHYDYINAKELSQAHLQGFSNYFDDHLKKALGLGSAMNPYMKTKLCISLLTLPTISSDIKEQCRGERIESLTGQAIADFDSLASKDFETRACAYADFRAKERSVSRR